jgi:shikimate dehydrogenase
VAEFDLVVNATPIGMNTHVTELPFNLQTLRKDAVVFDVVFNPPLTALGRTCHERGNPFVSGVRWLVHRVAYQIGLYAPRQAPLDVLEKVLLNTIPHFFPRGKK